jgi:hypothetical protein
VLLLDSSYERLLVHGLAEFHGLISVTRQGGEEAEVHVMSKTAPSGPDSTDVSQRYPTITCTDVLLASAACSSSSGLVMERELEEFMATHIHGVEVV